METTVTLFVDGTLTEQANPSTAARALAELFQVTEAEVRPLLDGSRVLTLPDLPRDVAASTHRRLLASGLRPRVIVAEAARTPVTCPGCGVRHPAAVQCALCGENVPGAGGAAPGPPGPGRSERLRTYRQARLGLHFGTILFAAALFMTQALGYLNERMRDTMLRDTPLEPGAWIYLPALLVLGYGIFHLLKAKGFSGWWSALSVAGPIGLGIALLLPRREGGADFTGDSSRPTRVRGRTALIASACVAVSVWWLWDIADRRAEAAALQARSEAIVQAAGARVLEEEQRSELERDLRGIRDELAGLLAEGALSSSQVYAVTDGFYAATAAVIMVRARSAYYAHEGDGLTLKHAEGDVLRTESERIWQMANEGLPEPRRAGKSFQLANRDWRAGYHRVHEPDVPSRRLVQRLSRFVIDYRWAINMRDSDPDRSYPDDRVELPEPPPGVAVEEEGRYLRLSFGDDAPPRFRGHTLNYALFQWPRTDRASTRSSREAPDYASLFLRTGGSLPDKYLHNHLKAVDAPVPER